MQPAVNVMAGYPHMGAQYPIRKDSRGCCGCCSVQIVQYVASICAVGCFLGFIGFMVGTIVVAGKAAEDARGDKIAEYDAAVEYWVEQGEQEYRRKYEGAEPLNFPVVTLLGGLGDTSIPLLPATGGSEATGISDRSEDGRTDYLAYEKGYVLYGSSLEFEAGHPAPSEFQVTLGTGESYTAKASYCNVDRRQECKRTDEDGNCVEEKVYFLSTMHFLHELNLVEKSLTKATGSEDPAEDMCAGKYTTFQNPSQFRDEAQAEAACDEAVQQSATVSVAVIVRSPADPYLAAGRIINKWKGDGCSYNFGTPAKAYRDVAVVLGMFMGIFCCCGLGYGYCGFLNCVQARMDNEEYRAALASFHHANPPGLVAMATMAMPVAQGYASPPVAQGYHPFTTQASAGYPASAGSYQPAPVADPNAPGAYPAAQTTAQNPAPFQPVGF